MSGTPRSRDVTYVDVTFGVVELRDASVSWDAAFLISFYFCLGILRSTIFSEYLLSSVRTVGTVVKNLKAVTRRD